MLTFKNCVQNINGSDILYVTVEYVVMVYIVFQILGFLAQPTCGGDTSNTLD